MYESLEGGILELFKSSEQKKIHQMRKRNETVVLVGKLVLVDIWSHFMFLVLDALVLLFDLPSPCHNKSIKTHNFHNKTLSPLNIK